jgi:putative CocE/NonD family hydrolase
MSGVDRNVAVEMPDGVLLTTDVHHPEGCGPFPTLLMRTCYDKVLIGEYLGLGDFVDAGFRVVLQDCRGSGGSGGQQDHLAESVDGRATGDWIAGQPWFDGQLGTFGASYMGFTQWALAVTRPPYLKAMAISLSSARGARSWFPGGSFALDITLPWTMTMVFGLGRAQEPELQQRLVDGFDHLPLREAAQLTTGKRVHWWDRWMDHPSADDPFWKPLDCSDAVDLDVPILFMDGWYDYPTLHMVREFQQRDEAGLPSRLVVGAGTHFGAGVDERSETLRWFDRHLKGVDLAPQCSPVSVFVLPDLGWRDLPAWPPPSAPDTWFLQPQAGLGRTRSEAASTTPYVYDPSDPTPAFGGPSLRMDKCGPVDNRELEARSDVLTFTSAPLAEPVLTIGPIEARLFLRSDVDHFDVYLRVCDVLPTGESINVSEVIRRLGPIDIDRDEDGVFEIVLDVRPIAQQFASGNRIRVQVSGGAHPMFARNTCSGEPLSDAVTLVVAHNEVLHGERYSSAVTMYVPT